MAFLLLAGTTFLAWGPASSRGAFAETVPQALRADIHVRKALVTEGAGSPPVRIAKDPRNSTLYYWRERRSWLGALRRAGGRSPRRCRRRSAQISTFERPIGRHLSSQCRGGDEQIRRTADHGLHNTQGMAIGANGTIYLVGNSDVSDATTQGTIVKGKLGPGGRVWSVLARTAGYPKSKTAYDHRLNGIIVDQTEKFVYVNSGSRTDHGEVQSADGIYPGVREVVPPLVFSSCLPMAIASSCTTIGPG
jgi:hypothetical protein